MANNSRIYLSSPHLGAQEFEFVKEAFATNWIAPLGPHVDKFESEFCALLAEQAQRDSGSVIRDSESMSRGSDKRGQTNNESLVTNHGAAPLHAAALSSGTAALHLALKLVGVKAGDEVFCSSLTFSASANPIVYEGGKPVFIDSERQSWNMDPVRLEEALEDRKKKGKLPREQLKSHACYDVSNAK